MTHIDGDDYTYPSSWYDLRTSPERTHVRLDAQEQRIEALEQEAAALRESATNLAVIVRNLEIVVHRTLNKAEAEQ